jgi:hypothetical protein
VSAVESPLKGRLCRSGSGSARPDGSTALTILPGFALTILRGFAVIILERTVDI